MTVGAGSSDEQKWYFHPPPPLVRSTSCPLPMPLVLSLPNPFAAAWLGANRLMLASLRHLLQTVLKYTAYFPRGEVLNQIALLPHPIRGNLGRGRFRIKSKRALNTSQQESSIL